MEEPEKKGLKKLLGNLGNVGEKILGTLGTVTGIKAFDIAADLIKNEESLTPEQKAEILKDIQHEREIALEYYKSDQQDRASARDMRVQTNNSDKAERFSKLFPDILAGVIVLSAIVFGLLLFWVEVPETNKRMVELFCDVFLFGGAVTVVNFFYGSSKGSKDKDLKKP